MDCYGYRHETRSGAVIDFTQDELYPQWAAEQLSIDREYFGKCTTIALWREGTLYAVAVYSSFNGINCEVTIAAIKKWWMRQDILKILMGYPFKQLGCYRITLLISDSNEKTRRAAEHVGFVAEGYMREFMKNGEGCHIFGMTCKEYEGLKYEQS